MWRHGDVLIQACKKIPDSAQLLPHLILARGEITGHAHRIRERDGVELFHAGDEMFLCVSAKIATIIHEEHAPIELSQGIYRVWIQREYTPKEIRRVLD